MSLEEWRDVAGWEDRYEVSSLGRVRSKSFLKHGRNRHGPISYMTKPKLLKQNEIENGYLQVKLYAGDGSKTSLLVHRLVALAFLPNPENKPEVNHLNSQRTCNVLSNLEWATLSENSRHGYEHGFHTGMKGVEHPRTEFVDDDIRTIRRLHAEGMTLAALGRMYNVTYQAISHIVTRKNWSHVT